MKKTTLLQIVSCLLVASFTLLSFTITTPPKSTNITHTKKAGKAYWFSYYTAENDKVIYITPIYNNDCNHCSNQISDAFVKYLIMNDYYTNASTLHVINLQDVDQANLDERRNEKILERKKKGYSVRTVNFKYTDK